VGYEAVGVSSDDDEGRVHEECNGRVLAGKALCGRLGRRWAGCFREVGWVGGVGEAWVVTVTGDSVQGSKDTTLEAC
jgi:hypothetical protein